MRRALACILSGLILISTSICAAAQQAEKAASQPAEKKEPLKPEQLQGSWKIAKENGKEIKDVEQVTIDFTKDGKLRVFGNDVATYKINGEHVVITPADANGKAQPRQVEIKKIDADTIVLINESDKKEAELKRPGAKAPAPPPMQPKRKFPPFQE